MQPSKPAIEPRKSTSLFKCSLAFLLMGVLMLVWAGRWYNSPHASTFPKSENFMGLYMPLMPMVTDGLVELIEEGMNRVR